jgi:hypothetical protein
MEEYPKMIHTQKTIKGCDISVIYSDRYWIFLTNRTEEIDHNDWSHPIVKCWSQKRISPIEFGLPENLSQTIRCIETTLKQDTDLSTLILFIPDWDFWGSGIPAPISGYYHNRFKEDMLKVSANS